jgi:hypothetical protein
MSDRLSEYLQKNRGYRVVGPPRTYGRDNDLLAVVVERDGHLVPVAISYKQEASSGPVDLAEALSRALNRLEFA